MSEPNQANSSEYESFEIEETLLADEAEFVEPSHVYGVRG